MRFSVDSTMMKRRQISQVVVTIYNCGKSDLKIFGNRCRKSGEWWLKCGVGTSRMSVRNPLAILLCYCQDDAARPVLVTSIVSTPIFFYNAQNIQGVQKTWTSRDRASYTTQTMTHDPCQSMRFQCSVEHPLGYLITARCFFMSYHLYLSTLLGQLFKLDKGLIKYLRSYFNR